LGADRFLVKPVDLDDVVAMVRRTVKERARH
jgi:DNA-binding response OmpR family regulator